MLRQDFFEHVAQTSDYSIGLEVERAEGIYLIGPDERKTIDFISGICVSNLGHGLPEIVRAVQAQAARYLHPMVYGEVIMSPQVAYATRLAECLGGNLQSVYFGNSGAESIEGALKIAKKYTGRSQIISCWNAYHGSTHGALSVTGNEEMKEGYGPMLPDVSFIRFNELADLGNITAQTAAVIVEIIQGAGGVVMPQEGYLAALKKRCEAMGALLIVDEIQTGLGRTGTLFAHQWAGIEPDILVLAKALGGGMPLGAFITRQEVMAVIRKDPVLGHITTFGGHPVSCAAGLAALGYLLAHKLMEKIPALENILLNMLQHPAIKELRGRGLMYALLFEDFATAERVRAIALQKGLLTIGFLNIDHGLRLTPPLTIGEAEMRHSCQVLLDSIEEAIR
jgi:acetylornithine/N-succinyldiaminopimelate aminotransferase